MKFLAASPWLLSFFCLTAMQIVGCENLKDDETTRQGYSATMDIKEKGSRKIIQGTAILEGQDDPLENVFVEVFAYDSSQKELKRVAGCRTNANGKFIFSNLPKGKYIVRLSKDGGYMITEVTVKVSPKSKLTKEISAGVRLGV